MDPWTALTTTDGWSVYGMRTKVDGAERCFVIASTRVSMIEMNHSVGKRAFETGDFMTRNWTSATIKQRLSGDMEVGEGDTFAEAMVDLFGRWNPDEKAAVMDELTTGV